MRALASVPCRRAVIAVVCLLVLGLAPARAAAIETVVQDDALLLHSDEAQIRKALERIRDLGIDRVRVTAGWSVIAPDPESRRRPDFDATDPAAYPDGIWRNLDRIVRMSDEAGVETMIDIAFWAPRWATEDAKGAQGRFNTEIDANEYARFATAVARRYSGGWTPPAPPAPGGDTRGSSERAIVDEVLGKPAAKQPPAEQPKPLPAVDTFTIWNEPNHPGFLRPQWQRVDGRWVPRSPHIYRAMVRAAYPAIKRAAPGARVLIGGTASMGASRPGGFGVPPLRFLRELACVDERLAPVTTGACAAYEQLPGDGWAHHPYSLRTRPDADTIDPDKLPVAGTARLISTLRALVAAGRIAPAVADVYMTEYGYETNRPDPKAPFSLGEQPGLLAHAEFIGTADPAVRMWPQFQLYDRPSAPPRPGMREYGDWQSGLFFADGSPKPAAATFATPVHAECAPGAARPWVLVWGRLRNKGFQTSARVEVRGRAGRWRAVESADRPGAATRTAHPLASGEAVRLYVPYRRGARYRLRWTGSHGDRRSPDAGPSGASCRSAWARVARAKRARAA